ncbi:MAG: hypothetical protein M0Q41_07585 [Bacteroidales bacterium]|nr:hypothetical protein [Bacteroidales bacterium]
MEYLFLRGRINQRETKTHKISGHLRPDGYRDGKHQLQIRAHLRPDGYRDGKHQLQIRAHLRPDGYRDGKHQLQIRAHLRPDGYRDGKQKHMKSADICVPMAIGTAGNKNT